jgi:hypothetical protein
VKREEITHSKLDDHAYSRFEKNATKVNSLSDLSREKSLIFEKNPQIGTSQTPIGQLLHAASVNPFDVCQQGGRAHHGQEIFLRERQVGAVGYSYGHGVV